MTGNATIGAAQCLHKIDHGSAHAIARRNVSTDSPSQQWQSLFKKPSVSFAILRVPLLYCAAAVCYFVDICNVGTGGVVCLFVRPRSGIRQGWLRFDVITIFLICARAGPKQHGSLRALVYTHQEVGYFSALQVNFENCAVVTPRASVAGIAVKQFAKHYRGKWGQTSLMHPQMPRCWPGVECSHHSPWVWRSEGIFLLCRWCRWYT